MSTDKNKRDIDLLESNPERLLTHYQSIIEAVVSRFINRGFFDRSEKMDVVQTLNTQLLEFRLGRIKEQFNGSVYLSTYFSKVIYNACQEIIRKQKRHANTLSDEHLTNVSESSINAHQKMVLEDELFRFEGILQTFHHKKPKVELCLRLMSRAALNKAALGPYYLIGPSEMVKELKSKYFGGYEEKNDKDLYDAFVPLFNSIENKKNDGDSLRKWTNTQADKVIDLLNGNPPSAKYERETLKILMRMYFNKLDENEGA